MCDNIRRKRAKRSFAEAWLNDERFKSWIRKVSSDDSLYHCTICDKNISCNTHILRHVNSACHKENLKESGSLLNNVNKKSKKKIVERRKFNLKWLENKLFKPWLRVVPNDRYSFFCTLCEKSMVGGLSQIYRHGECKAHIQNKKQIETEYGNMNENMDENSNMRDETLSSFEERKKAAEIRFVALIADKNISHKTAKEILRFFQEVEDFNILKNIHI